MDKKLLSIGVFDSGMGGLTVLKAMQEALPNESFTYLGDTARLPYGTKSPETVKQYAIQMTDILIERQIKALVIACNTATTAALSHLTRTLTDLPVIGVVTPGADAAVKATRNQRIAILATETTIASHAYEKNILKKLPNAQVKNLTASLLVALAEEGMVRNGVAHMTLNHYLQHLQDEDTLLLGCTHFPVFQKTMSDLLSPEIIIIDSAHATALALKELLKEKELLRSSSEKGQLPESKFLVTDSIERFARVGEIFLGQALNLHDIELVDTKR